MSLSKDAESYCAKQPAPRIRLAWLVTSALVSPLAAVAALLAGTAMLPSSAQACYTGPYPANITGANTCISVTGTSFTGNLTNSGTVTPGGISIDTSTVTGQVV